MSEVLETVNGFYAFESALHVFPTRSTTGAMDLERWNHSELWRSRYRGMADSYLFFAEDIFGGQFAAKDGTVFSFDPETGEGLPMASSIDEWASRLLADFEVETGFPLAHDWQVRNGPILEGFRLLPKTPFVLGGEYEVENLHALESSKGMRLRAELAVQIRDLPDGAMIKYSVTD
ncbi:SMI1/KNR4 family protein [Streptomyces sp. Ru71]|nr:SMI1/KNR4 family protein [Streptomyces sp. Ru71]